MNIDFPRDFHIPLLRSLWKESFHDSEDFINAFFQTAFSTDRCIIVLINEKPAAALYWFDCLYLDRRIAYLYAVATAKNYRGQGLCHQLLEDTHLHLTGLGYEGTILVPGNKELFKLYAGMGYEICSSMQEIYCTKASERTQIHLIDTDEYAKLRRQFLPKGGVIQENENLYFFQTQAKFYAGPEFLLAAREDVGILYGIEFLGNVMEIPKILQSFGYEKGRFRIPGEKKDIPFSMYHPLKNSNLPPPSYFGLAFD